MFLSELLRSVATKIESCTFPITQNKMTQARIADVINDNNSSYIEHSVHEKEIHQRVMEGVPPINEQRIEF
jgi:hypothetical protein